MSACQFVKLDGFKYKPGFFLIIELDLNYGKLSVGLIKDIYVVDGSYFFHLQLCTFDNNHSNLNCLEISLVSKYDFINFKELYFKQPQFGMLILNVLYLQVRYYHHLLLVRDV